MAIREELQTVCSLANQVSDTLRTLGDQLSGGSAQPLAAKIGEAKAALLEVRDMLSRGAAPQVESYSERRDRVNQESEVAQHYDTFSEEFQKFHTSKEEFLDGFRAARKLNPRLTGEQFVRPARS